MKKTIYIEGMSCNHCKMRVEKALGELDAVTQVSVDLENKCAAVELSADVTDAVLTETVDDAGYDVVKIEA